MTNDHSPDPLRDLIHQSLVSDKLSADMLAPSAELRTALDARLDQRLDDEAVITPAKPQPQEKPRRRIVRPWHMALVITAVLAVMVYLSLPEKWKQLAGVNNVDLKGGWSRQVDQEESIAASEQAFPPGNYQFHDTHIPPPTSSSEGLATLPEYLQSSIAERNETQIELDPTIGESAGVDAVAISGRGAPGTTSKPAGGSVSAMSEETTFSSGGAYGDAGFPEDDGRSRAFGLGPNRPSNVPRLQQGQLVLEAQRSGPSGEPIGFKFGNDINDRFSGGEGYVDIKAEELERAKQAARRALATLTKQLSQAAMDGEKVEEIATLAKQVKELGDQISTVDSRAEYLRQLDRAPGTEQYAPIIDNPFLPVKDAPLSTFSIDVDTASYANVRRFLTQGQVPPADAVRIEELLNYFTYDYPAPKGDEPFSVNMETAPCPWQEDHLLLRVGLKGKEVHKAERPASNLVFLIDTSGSMSDEDKLPLVKQAMSMLTRELGERDRITIVTYAGEAGLKLAPTNGGDHATITSVINSLNSAGSTHGSAGIQLAYEKARESFLKEGTNRVILCTDGDLNVGVTQDDQLVDLITKEAKSGVFLTVLGFGQGNLKDAKMEKLADHGNGMYAYIDGVREAKKVLVDQLSGSLETIAKDVKIQIEFNPAQVRSYRLIGYENRLLAAKDFNDDTKDAGEIGAGHTVTALYELVLAGAEEPKPVLDDLKYQRAASVSDRSPEGEGEKGRGGEGEEKAEGDAAKDDKPEIRMYPITTVEPRDVLKVLQNRYADQPQVRLAVDPKMGSVVAHATPSQHATINALIDEMLNGDVQKELLTLKLRFKQPDGDVSKKIEYPLAERGAQFRNASADFRFAASVAGFGMILRDSPHRGGITMAGVGEIAASALGEDARGYRAEFLDLVRRVEKLGKR